MFGSSVFKNFFAEAKKKEKPTTREELSGKIKELGDKMQHELAAKNQKIHSLKKFVKGKSKKILQSHNCIRYLSGIKRHNNMIRVYETSISALEETLANIEAQRVHSETTAMIGMVSRSIKGINVDEADDSFAKLDEFKQEREELASMMAASINDGDIDFSDLMLELELTFEEDEAEREVLPAEKTVHPVVDVSQFASVPTTELRTIHKETNDDKGPKSGGGIPLREEMRNAF